METAVIYLIIGAVCAGIGHSIASDDNKVMAAWISGLFGPFGLLISTIAFRK